MAFQSRRDGNWCHIEMVTMKST
ncbi:hypothetical protein FJZ31_41515 [Candidatus Poribacteria bacterium]|nr:hypothetical protein [Candidatus Poribacteria bacterium]